MITARLLQPMETDPEASARALLHTFAEGMQHPNPGAVIEGDSREEYQMTRIIELQRIFDRSRALDFLAPLALRPHVIPVFWMAGTRKLKNMESTIEGFGNPDWGLGLPFPAAMAWAAGLSEAGGTILPGAGLAVRWATLPLMVTIAVAAITVHWENGWPPSRAAAPRRFRRQGGFMQRLAETYPRRYAYITEPGRPVAPNNGIEFAATDFVMLMALFFPDGGRFVSIDYWLGRRFITY